MFGLAIPDTQLNSLAAVMPPADPSTPTSGLTPRPSFANLNFFKSGPASESVAVDQMVPINQAPDDVGLPSSSPPVIPNPDLWSDFHDYSEQCSDESESDPPRLDNVQIVDECEDSPAVINSQPPELLCQGQRIQWVAGSVWDTYAYEVHSDDSVPWILLGFEGDNSICI